MLPSTRSKSVSEVRNYRWIGHSSTRFNLSVPHAHPPRSLFLEQICNFELQ